MDLVLRQRSSQLAASSKTRTESYTLETIYNEAMEEVKALHTSGKLSDEYYFSLIQTKRPEDLHLIVEEENKQRVEGQTRVKRSLNTIVSSTVEKLERYAGAIDMIAQSSPQALGLNIVGLVWGSLKVLMIIAQDIAKSFEMIDQTLHDLERSLPILESLTKLYGTSEIQLLRQPLVDIYASIVSLGLVVIRLCERGPLDTLGRSVWNSLQCDLNAGIARLEKAGKLVEQAASVEHMHATRTIGTEQEREIYRQERFRREVRSHWSQPRNDGTKAQAVPINDAPLGILTAHFTGRKSELAKIRSMLTPRQDNIPAQCAIVGMPGLGKTQLALKHTLEVFDQARGPIIFWTSAATTEKLAQGLCKILDLVDHVDRDHTDQNVRLSAAQRWLEGTGHDFPLPWLLVLDNVNEQCVPFLREHLPRTNECGAMLFTMRNIDVASALVTSDLNQAILELEVLSPADASNLLLAELQASKPDETASQIVKAEKLVKSVGRLPLAIGHVASFANQHLKGLDYILHLFEDQHAMEVLGWDNSLSKYEQRSVMITFSSKLDELAAASPVNSLLLQMLSLFDPESIALDMIKQGAYPIRDLRAYSEERKPELSEPPMPMHQGALSQPKRRFMRKLRDKLHRRAGSPFRIDGVTGQTKAPTCNSQDEDIDDSRALEISKLLDDPVEFPKAIQLLRKSSFLTHQSSDHGGDIRIHDLVRSVIRHRARQSVSDSLCFRMAAATVDYVLFAVDYPWLSSEFWSLYEMGLPHYRSLVAFQMEQQGCSIALARASRAVASYLNYRGRGSEAIKTIKEILPLQEDYHGVKNLDYIESLNELAFILHEEDAPEAESLLEQSLKLRREALGDTHLGTLEAMTNLAEFYSSLDRHEEALTLTESVVDTMKLRFGTEHEYTLQQKRDLARVYVNQGRYREAESLYEDILETASRTSANRDFLTWTTLCDLGVLKFRLYHLDAAELLLTQADARSRSFLDTSIFRCLTIRRSLGSLHEFKGNYLEAESLLREVLTEGEKIYGTDYWLTIAAVEDLAWLYVDMERFGDGEVLFFRMVETLERMPERANHLGRTIAALAFVIEQQGRAAEAEAMYRTTFDQGSQSPDLEFLVTAPLSRLFCAQGRNEDGQLLYEIALDDLEEHLTWLYRNGIYGTQKRWHRFATIGRVFEDEEMSQIALKVQQEKIGLAHPVTQKTVQALLKILHKKGKMDEEEALLQRCKDAGVDIPPYSQREQQGSKAGDGEGNNAVRNEGTVVMGEDEGEGAVQNDLDLAPGRSAKSLGKMRTF